MSGNLLDRRLAAVVAAAAAGCRHVWRICGRIAPASMLVVFAFAALAADALDSRLSDDVALTKATVSLLAARDFGAVRERLDPGMGPVSDDRLLPMADLISASEPISIETIWATEVHSFQTGDGNSRMVLEYALAGKWVVVDAVVKTQAASKRFARLFLTANTQPLRELNAFHLFGKGRCNICFWRAGWPRSDSPPGPSSSPSGGIPVGADGRSSP